MLGMLIISVTSWYFSEQFPLLSASTAIVFVSAISASFAVHRLERPSNQEKPSVLQSFEETDSSEPDDFGLKNFGPGSAHYIQLLVKVNGLEEPVWQLKPLEKPVHLEEGEFLSLLNGDHFKEDSPLRNYLQDDDGYSEEDELHLHYSYVSSTGVRIPFWVSEDRGESCVLGELDDRSVEDARGMKLKNIASNCL